MDWLRWWHGTVTDPKFQRVARMSGASVANVLAVWACLLEEASTAEDRGSITGFDCDDFDVLLGLDDGVTFLIVEAMTSRGMIVDGRIAAWETRQPVREDQGDEKTGAMSAAERKRLQREREKHSKESRDVTHGHETSRDVTHGHAPDEDTERDKDLKPRVLNDDSGNSHSLGAEQIPPSSSVNPIQSRAIELAVMIRKRGGAVNADDPHIQSWANSGVTDAQALTALETAKQQRASKGDISPINSGYLNSILQNQTNPQAKARASPQNGGLSAKDAERKRVADEMFRRGEYAEPKHEIDITGSAVVVDGSTVRAIRGDVRPKLD